MKTVLLVNDGPPSKYDYLKAIVDCRYHVVLVKNRPAVAIHTDWHRKLVPEEDVVHVPCRNPSKAIQVVQEYLYRRHLSPDGIFTYRDTGVPLTQYLSKALHLPAICDGDIFCVRNKGLMRTRLKNAGLAQPDFRTCGSRDEAVAAAEELGPPIVVKPAEMVSSLGVQKLTETSRPLVEAAFDHAVECDFETERLRYEFNLSPQVIVERYVASSEEISVEGLVVGGLPRIIAITKKRVMPVDGLEFAEVGHAVPYQTNVGRHREIENTVCRALAALGIRNSAFHAELLLNESLAPVITEVGARLAGDFIPMLVETALGVNFFEATIGASEGKDILHSSGGPTQFAGIDFVPFGHNAASLRNHFADILTQPGVVQASIYPTATHGRVGHLMYAGSSAEEIASTSRRLLSLLSKY